MVTSRLIADSPASDAGLTPGWEGAPTSISLAVVARSAQTPVGADWSDAALIDAVVERSNEAHAELYRRHRASVGAVTRMVLGNGPGCDEVVNDVFVELWLTPEDFDPTRGSLLSFLRLKARCRSIDVLRSERSRTRREERDSFAQRATVPEVDLAVLDAERSDELRSAVASLPLREREAIRLAFFHGMSYRDVALHLDVAEGTVKSRIRKGLRQLSLSGTVRVHHDVLRSAPGPISMLATRDELKDLGQSEIA
jgi:RNA polymerase sigma-70 factor (ECF subfamily)